MSSNHWVSGYSNLIDNVLEHLSVSKHPESIQEEDDWGVAEDCHGVHGHLVIHGWRELVAIGNLPSLRCPEDEEGEDSYWEKHWKSKSIHHGHIDDIEEARVFVVDNMVWSCVEIKVGIDLSLLCFVETLCLTLLP